MNNPNDRRNIRLRRLIQERENLDDRKHRIYFMCLFCFVAHCTLLAYLINGFFGALILGLFLCLLGLLRFVYKDRCLFKVRSYTFDIIFSFAVGISLIVISLSFLLGY